MAIVFTTTIDGQDSLFEDVHDTCPILSRCIEIALSRRRLSEAFAQWAREIGQAERLDGAGWGVRRIAHELSRRGIVNRAGGKWLPPGHSADLQPA